MRLAILENIPRRGFLRAAFAGVAISFGVDKGAKYIATNGNGEGPDDAGPAARKAEFYAFIREARLLGRRLTDKQVAGIESVFAAYVTHGDGNSKTLAYALATVAHETGRRMECVREGFATTDRQARRILYKRWYAKSAGKYGHAYYGRGFPQLTGLNNYRRASGIVGVDLVKSPDRALEPEISAWLLFHGLQNGIWNGSRKPHTGKGIGHYLPAHGRDDVKNARRTVNGLDRWQEVARFYHGFRAALLQSKLY